MTEKNVNLARVFLESIRESVRHQIAYNLARKLARKDVWLIGSALYRPIAHQLHNGAGRGNGIVKPVPDFDFIVDGFKVNPRDFKSGLVYATNTFGQHRFNSAYLSVDLVSLPEVSFIKKYNLSPTIGSYLRGTPLDVQAMAFEINTGVLSKLSCAETITQRVVGINNREELIAYCAVKGISPEEYVQRAADNLGFGVRK